MTQPIAYTIDGAAEATGYSKTVVKQAIADGAIVPRYANSKPVIPATELVAWIESLPTEPKRAA